MQFLFRINAEKKMDQQLESDEKVNSEEIVTKDDEKSKGIPPSYSNIFLISEN